MDSGITRDPNTALSGLIAVALIGVLLIGGGLVANGAFENSWIQVVSGLVFSGAVSWFVWSAGQVVRRSLKMWTVKEGSGP